MQTIGGGDPVTTVEERWDPGQLDALRAEYEPLRRFAAVIGRWDVEPDDLVQEAYAKVLVKCPSDIRDLGAYLRRMIVNLATDERRRVGRAASFAPKLATAGASAGPRPSRPRSRATVPLPIRIRATSRTCSGCPRECGRSCTWSRSKVNRSHRPRKRSGCRVVTRASRCCGPAGACAPS